jgi:transcriptional regulator of acetoin/glycerol metabolism
MTDQGEWIEQVDRLDRMLHAQGVPSAVRCKAIGEIATILTQASKQKQDRRQLVLTAVAEHGNVRKAAKAEGWSHETFYAELRRKLSNSPVTI